MMTYIVYKPAIEELAPVLACLCGYRRESAAESQPSGTYNLTPRGVFWRRKQQV
jgi:hypothetical protein